MDRAMIMQLNLLPVARKMVLEELEMKKICMSTGENCYTAQ